MNNNLDNLKNTMKKIDRYVLTMIIVFVIGIVLVNDNGCSCVIDSKQSATISVMYSCKGVPPEKLVEAHKNCLDSFGTKGIATAVSTAINNTCTRMSKELLCEPKEIKTETSPVKKKTE